MELDERSVLSDCLESLKQAANQYLHASLDSDGDGLRKRLSRIALDKAEQSFAVSNMMHQAGILQSESAPDDQVELLAAEAKEILGRIGGPSYPVDRERR